MYLCVLATVNKEIIQPGQYVCLQVDQVLKLVPVRNQPDLVRLHTARS
jgi:hypothetical protein